MRAQPANCSICPTPPRTEVTLRTQQRQAIQFQSTKLNRFPLRTNAQLARAASTTNTHAHRQSCSDECREAPHTQVHNRTHWSADTARRSTHKPKCFALTPSAHSLILSPHTRNAQQKAANTHRRATHGLQQAGTTCAEQHECVSDTVSLCHESIATQSQLTERTQLTTRILQALTAHFQKDVSRRALDTTESHLRKHSKETTDCQNKRFNSAEQLRQCTKSPY